MRGSKGRVEHVHAGHVARSEVAEEWSGLHYRPAAVACVPSVVQVWVSIVQGRDRIEERGQVGSQRSNRDVLDLDVDHRVGLDGCGQNNSVCSWTATSNGKEDIRILTRRSGDDLSIREYNFSAENLIRSQAKVSRCRTMAATLHPAAEAADRRSTTTDNNDVVLLG